jgi:hypothetical protein
MVSLMDDLKKHIQTEENKDLVYLAHNVTTKNLQHAGTMFAMKKNIVPTPSIPDKPIALEATIGLLIAPIDKFKDLLSSFPNEKYM